MAHELSLDDMKLSFKLLLDGWYGWETAKHAAKLMRQMVADNRASWSDFDIPDDLLDLEVLIIGVRDLKQGKCSQPVALEIAKDTRAVASAKPVLWEKFGLNDGLLNELVGKACG